MEWDRLKRKRKVTWKLSFLLKATSASYLKTLEIRAQIHQSKSMEQLFSPPDLSYCYADTRVVAFFCSVSQQEDLAAVGMETRKTSSNLQAIHRFICYHQCIILYSKVMRESSHCELIFSGVQREEFVTYWNECDQIISSETWKKKGRTEFNSQLPALLELI